MISFFRGTLSSKLALGLFALIMIAFIITGVETPSGLGGLGGGSGTRIARIGSQSLDATEIENRVRRELQAAQQQQPGIDMATFVRAGGVERVVEQMVTGLAMEQFGREHGLSASKRLVDGEIASISAFKGPNGKFDNSAFQQVLAQQGINEAQLREELAGDAIRRMMLIPIGAAPRATNGYVSPYAALLLEVREGRVGVVPTALLRDTKAPADAELQAFYRTNVARYTMPERRVLRYATFGRDQVAAKSVPTEAEIAQFYQANAALYGAKEERTLSQVVLDSEAKARDFAAKLKSGTSFADAARAAGFAPADTAVGRKSQADFAKLTSAAVAAAAFATPEGQASAPAKSDFGWHVVKVDAVHRIAGKSLAEARAEIAASLAKQKQDEALSALAADIENAISDGASFDEVVKAQKLTAVSTPPLLQTGAAPDAKGYTPDPSIAPLLKPAFDSSPDDDPTVETIGQGERYALLSVTKVVPAAPIPFAQVRAGVTEDFIADRASKRAKAIAEAVLAKVNAGTAIDKAFAEAGVKLPAPQPARARRAEVASAGERAPRPLITLFSLPAGKAGLVEVDGGQGWFVVKLDKITEGDVSKQPGLVDATRGELSRVLGDEYVEQFAAAARAAVGAEINTKALAALKSRLAGSAAAQ